MSRLSKISVSVCVYCSVLIFGLMFTQINLGSAKELKKLGQVLPVKEPISLPPNGGVVAPAKSAVAKSQEPLFPKPEIIDIVTGEALHRLSKNQNIKANYIIKIRISHPKEFLEQRPQDNTKLVLYADGVALSGMTTDYFTGLGANYIKDRSKYLADKQWITFIFTRDSTTKNAWNSLFKLTDWKSNKAEFDLSLGWEGMFPLSYAAKVAMQHKITLVYYPTYIFYPLCILYLIFLIIFIDRCKKTGLIREPDKIRPGQHGPYSLAQTQLAFWTVIISGGFIYLILLTGLADAINDSCLILLGITGSTTGIAGFIDFTKKQSQDGLLNTAPVFIKPHKDFLTDITSDGVNISVQRTQTILWNFILGIYFIWYVVSNKSMPVFDNILLLLAGVSSLMYLTSKGAENPQPSAPSTTLTDTSVVSDDPKNGIPPIPDKPLNQRDTEDLPPTPLPPTA